MIVLGDAPEAWARLGFAPDAEGVVALGEERLLLSGRGGGILSVSAPGVTGSDPDGLPLGPGEADAPVESAHPNGASAVDHVVVLTGSLARTVAALEEAGLDLRRTTEDGRMAFLRLGSYILEVVERGGDPARFWGLVVVVPDSRVDRPGEGRRSARAAHRHGAARGRPRHRARADVAPRVEPLRHPAGRVPGLALREPARPVADRLLAVLAHPPDAEGELAALVAREARRRAAGGCAPS